MTYSLIHTAIASDGTEISELVGYGEDLKAAIGAAGYNLNLDVGNNVRSTSIKVIDAYHNDIFRIPVYIRQE